MKIEIRCPCGRLLETFERGPEASMEAFLAAHEADVRSYECTDALRYDVIDTGAVDWLGRPIEFRRPGPPQRVVAGCGAAVLKRVEGFAPPAKGKTRHQRQKAHAARIAQVTRHLTGRPVGEPAVVVRGAGGAEAGRGRWSDVRKLHDEHVKRGGKFDKPEPRKAQKKPTKPPGTVTYRGVDIPPGTVQQVGDWIFDTTMSDDVGTGVRIDARGRYQVRVTPAPSEPPGKEKAHD